MEHKWIKVEEALPPRQGNNPWSETVLVHIVAQSKRLKYNTFDITYYNYSFNEWRLHAKEEDEDGGWYDDDPEGETTYTVTHWMPIPPIEEM